jgi:hypothetical protein
MPSGGMIGCGLQPSSFNNLHALPNKLFEFTQACLAVAIGSSPEMARIIQEYSCGIVTDDLALSSVARVLNQLTQADMHLLKASSDRAVRVHTVENNVEKLRGMVVSY